MTRESWLLAGARGARCAAALVLLAAGPVMAAPTAVDFEAYLTADTGDGPPTSRL